MHSYVIKREQRTTLHSTILKIDRFAELPNKAHYLLPVLKITFKPFQSRIKKPKDFNFECFWPLTYIFVQ